MLTCWKSPQNFLTAQPHIAPEVPSGHAKESFLSDVYSFGILAEFVANVD